MFLAKMTFNNNQWCKPSGSYGKLVSTPPYAYFYESDNGFGWEEWNFNPIRIHEDGYSYGFLQAVNNNHLIRGRTYNDVVLFTDFNGSPYIVAYLKKLDTLGFAQGGIARTHFQNIGHINSMRLDVIAVGGNIAAFNADYNSCINMKFLVSDNNIRILWGNFPNPDLKINATSKSFKDIFDISNTTLENRIKTKLTAIGI